MTKRRRVTALPKPQTGPTLAQLYSRTLDRQLLGNQSLHVDTIPLVHAVLEHIGFAGVILGACGDDGDVSAAAVIETLVHCRRDNLRPVPLSHLSSWAGRTILPHLLGVLPDKLNEYRAGRLLERLGSVAPGVWRQLILNVKLHYGLDLDLLVYDTTSIYFEGSYNEADLLQYGHSRDSKPNCKQVVVGLDVTGKDAIPVHFSVLPGNVSDGDATVQQNLMDVLALTTEMGFKSEDLIILGDRAMLSPRMIHVYNDHGVGYIGSMRGSDLTRDLARSVTEHELLSNPLTYQAAGASDSGGLYYGVRRAVTVERPTKDAAPEGRPKQLDQWALVVLASGKKRLDETHRETLLKRVEDRVVEIRNHLNKGPYKRKEYAKAQLDKAIGKYPSIQGLLTLELTGVDGELTLSSERNVQAIEHASILDGRYVIFFNRPLLSDDDIFVRFKQRDGVERRAGDVKHTVTVRPVYLHDEQRIRGLILITMVALLTTSLVERKLKRAKIPLTTRGLQDLFTDYTASALHFADGSLLVTFPRTSKVQALVLAAIGVTLDPFTSMLAGDAQEYWRGASEELPDWIAGKAPPDS